MESKQVIQEIMGVVDDQPKKENILSLLSKGKELQQKYGYDLKRTAELLQHAYKDYKVEKKKFAKIPA